MKTFQIFLHGPDNELMQQFEFTLPEDKALDEIKHKMNSWAISDACKEFSKTALKTVDHYNPDFVTGPDISPELRTNRIFNCRMTYYYSDDANQHHHVMKYEITAIKL